MTTIKEIEKAISDLPPEKLSILRSWFDKFDADRWDKQFEIDAKKGRLDSIAARVKENFKKGKCKEL
jgi:hypothetical protein